MSKLWISVFIVFLGVLGLFAMNNQEMITFQIPFGDAYVISKFTLILLSISTGAFLIFLAFFVRDTKHVIDNMQAQKRQKREAKVHSNYSKALNAILAHKDREAKEALLEILKDAPEHTDALLRLGDIAFKNEQYREALEHYKKARDISPSNLHVLFALEEVMEKMERYDDALRYLDEILESDSDNLTALQRKRAVLEKRGQWDELIALQKSILKVNPLEKEKQKEEQKLIGYKYEYARTSLENSEIEKAEKAFRTLLKLDTAFIPAYLGMAEVMLTKGEIEEAINFLEKSFEQLNSIVILARLEDMLISVGEPGRLIRFYKNAVARNPQDKKMKFLLGRLYYRLEMVDDAIETLNSIETGNSSAPDIFILRGELYLKRNQVAKALEEYKKGSERKKYLRVPYGCSNCGFKTNDWSGRCPQCTEWNTLTLDICGPQKG